MSDERYADLIVSTEGLISFDGESTEVSIILRDEDGIVAEGKDWGELVANVRAALTEARAQGAADERERLAKLADGGEDRYPAWIVYAPRDQSRPVVNQPFSDWLRSQKGEG